MKNLSKTIRLLCVSKRIQRLLIIFFILRGVPVFSQSVREISTKDGLPQSFVSGLVQDDTSFIWIGTRNGLARFDGNQFRIFQHNPYDTATLASNIIVWLRKDNHNQLWIEHESGEIDEMNPVTEKITHYVKGNLPDSGGIQFIRRGWLVDEDGFFWGIVKGAGIDRYDMRSKKAERFNRFNAGFSSDTVRGLVEIAGSGIFILSQRSITRYDKKTNLFTHWQIPFKQDYGDFPESDAIAVDLHQRRNKELMWGDRRALFFFDPSTHSFRTISLPSLSYLGIRWIRTGPDGMDYFENYGKVYRYDNQTGLTSIGKTITENFGDVKSFLVDHSGLIWIGTNAGGIHQIDLETPFFQSFVYRKDFSTDMLQQEMGINIQQMFNWTAKDNLFSSASYHFRSVYDSNHRLYMALKETVCYKDSLQNKFVRLPQVPAVAGIDTMGIGLKGITILTDGSPMVVGYSGNILVYHASVNRWETFIDPLLLRKKFGASLLPQDILADDKNIWITTANDGLLKINILTKLISQFKEDRMPGSLPTNQLLGFRADPRNQDILWIGSYQGLIGLNKKTLKCEVFSLKEGLPDNTIYSILSDRSGDLWLGTNKGICRFDPINHHTRVFNTRHGLPGDEFNRFHQLELPDGRLVFGGTQGWTIFDPLRMRNDEFEPVLAFTDLKINNKDANESKEHPVLPLPLNAVRQLILPYEQNTISIGFAGLEFSQPQDLQYRYRLEGYDNDWVRAGNSRQANYTKIPPGNYTLLVNASNTSGIWSTDIKTFSIRIKPPWYATWMAYLCYCIILAGLTWTFIRFRVSRIIMKEEMILKEKEANQLKEIDDMKSRFFSNITHEFRTPLTLIMGPAEQLKDDRSRDPQQNRLVDTIVSNAKQLLILINRLMDLSRLEAKALQLHEQHGKPADTVGSVVHSFERDAETKKILLSFKDQTPQMECWFYADATERIVYNLVSNALKFTPAQGRVDVQLSMKDKMLLLVVRDTGTGIAENKLPHIFDRFYQAAESDGLANEEQHRGTGIGLSLVKELVAQIEGRIEVESRTEAAGNASGGTVFTVFLPFRPYEDGQPTITYKAPDEMPDKLTEEAEKIPQILLVEDSAELAGFISGILAEKYQVSHVLNGALGLEYSLSAMPDLIISDVMMPVMDGYELCSRLKEDIRTSHIPVILLTARITQENLIEGLTKGADDYLTKPFHPSELLLRIHNQITRQRKLRDQVHRELAPDADDTIKIETLPQDIFLTRLYELMDEHLDEELFGVDQLAGVMNMSRSSLHRKLKALTGMSTTEVVRNYRLKRATQFLKEGFSSSDTAYKTGFGSPAYFTKSFREVYGLTPGEYVRKAQSLKPL